MIDEGVPARIGKKTVVRAPLEVKKQFHSIVVLCCSGIAVTSASKYSNLLSIPSQKVMASFHRGGYFHRWLRFAERKHAKGPADKGGSGYWIDKKKSLPQ